MIRLLKSPLYLCLFALVVENVIFHVLLSVVGPDVLGKDGLNGWRVLFFLKGLVLPYANKRFGEFTVIILFVRSTALDLHLG